MTPEKIHEYRLLYDELYANLKSAVKEEKVLIDFLQKMPESQLTYSMRDLERIESVFNTKYNDMKNTQNKLIEVIKTECNEQVHFFNFYAVPETLVRKKTSKKDFEILKKILLKVKKQYLVQKAMVFPDIPLDQLTITDDDQIPLELLDMIQSQ